MCDFVLSFGKPGAQEWNRLNLPMRGVVVFLKPHRVMLVSNPTYNAGLVVFFNPPATPRLTSGKDNALKHF